ncbi:MAG: efflux RND transporter periplasmic adaptor subunit [Azoarcus sp.]|jgi:membrane fusion protein (multidrug efflux system)|nr:efflux RND transporter periplasmic adaptor subunit [Azoarcus sp.]
MTIRFRQSILLTAALASAMILTACDRSQQTVQAPPPPPVSVLVTAFEPAPLVSELPGRTTPYMVAELRPQVTGIVQKRLFTEGSTVVAGQVLYQIDPSTYRAAYDSAAANKARADANLYNARLKADRYAELVGIEAVSRQANDDADAALKQAEADVASARAALDKAHIDLNFTQVKSPISGHIGRSSVTPGALVTANQAAALATVQQLDPIYVDLTQSSAELQRLRRDVERGALSQDESNNIPVQLLLEDGSQYEMNGKLAFSEVSVDPGTGSVTLRASFPNPKGTLLPGMYVRARLEQGQTGQAILLPHAAVNHDPRGNSVVMVVDAENKVASRPVQVRGVQGDKWIVVGGLAAGEQVIVEGLQKVRAGQTVQAQPFTAPYAPNGAATPQAVASAAANPASH